MFQRFLIPIYLPKWLHDSVVRAKHYVSPAQEEPLIDLTGDRDIEWSYIASRLPLGNGEVFDFGCGFGNMSIHAVQKGYRVLAADLESNHFWWSHPNVTIVSGDLLRMDLPNGSFDYVLNCSTVEHVGLTGRYGVAVEETDGDLQAMQVLRKILKPSGKMLMTIPCGQDASIAPYHRVYGKKRLHLLLGEYEVEEEVYWVKHRDNRWHPAKQDEALNYVPTTHSSNASKCSYALGCFVLRPIASSTKAE
jgi:SAM-dependent methyltransferase